MMIWGYMTSQDVNGISLINENMTDQKYINDIFQLQMKLDASDTFQAHATFP